MIDHILTACRREGLNKPATAYVLATAKHETGGRMAPVREAFGRSDAESYAKVTAWCKRKGKVNYAAIDRDTGQSYYGRGLVQITHRRNYAMASEKLGHDFVGSPDDVMLPHFAVTILVRGMKEGWFTGQTLADYIRSDHDYDFVQARRIVNVLNRAKTIARYAEEFLGKLA